MQLNIHHHFVFSLLFALKLSNGHSFPSREKTLFGDAICESFGDTSVLFLESYIRPLHCPWDVCVDNADWKVHGCHRIPTRCWVRLVPITLIEKGKVGMWALEEICSSVRKAGGVSGPPFFVFISRRNRIPCGPFFAFPHGWWEELVGRCIRRSLWGRTRWTLSVKRN